MKRYTGLYLAIPLLAIASLLIADVAAKSKQSLSDVQLAIEDVTAQASSSFINAKNRSDVTERKNLLDFLLNKKIEYYRRLYPDIAFLVMQGGDDLQNEMVSLDHVLGHQPKNMDYEHSSKFREDLMSVSVERILFMLQTGLPSAALFMADDPPGWQEYVCVLTINPAMVAANSISATGHLLDMPQQFINQIPVDMQLLAGDYLAFVIDHEVYHCLKSMYVGQQLMSYKGLWAEYNHFINEQAADAYALAMNIKTREEVSLFVKNILRIRGMALYSADPNHLTCNAIEQVLKIPTRDIINMSNNEVFDMANSIRDRLTPGYDEYVQQLASAVRAMEEIGVGEVSREFRNRIKGVQADPEQVKEFVTNSRRYFTELRGDELKQ